MKFRSLLFLALMALVFSCKPIHLFRPEADVYLRLKIVLHEEEVLDEGDEVVKMPEQVLVYFYDAETHEKVAEDLLPPEGGFVDIPAGTYDIIVYGLGCDYTKVDGVITRGTVRAYTEETGVQVRVTRVTDPFENPNQSINYEPDYLFVGKAEQVVVPVRSEEERTIVIDIVLRSIVERYTLVIKHLNGAEHLSSMQAYITGLAPAKYLWDGRFPNTQPVAVSYPVRLQAVSGEFHTPFHIFGRFTGPGNESYLDLIATDTAGNKFLWVFNVTDQFDNPDNTRHLIIVDEQMDIPDNPGDVGGFIPEVDEWGTIIIPINL